MSDVIGINRPGFSLNAIIESTLSVPSDTSALKVLELFLGNPELRVLPVVDDEVPVGMVNRNTVVELFSRPYRRDLFRRHPIARFMDARPIIVDIATDIDDLARRLVTAGLQQMLDGFLVVGPGGLYAGIGNAQNLLSEVTKRKQAHLHQMAHFDALTGLPNRILFRERLAAALSQSQRHGKPVAVVFIDVDHFKRINDTLGHPVGDELLRVVAERFRGEVRSSDTLARMGGDEFTLVLTHLAGMDDAAVVVRKLRDSLAEPILLAGQETMITASIGVAMFPGDGTDMDDLVRKADIALYGAKQAGRNTFRFFDKQHEVFDDSRLYMESALRNALANGGIHPVYQPLVDARSGEVTGVEVLARWNHPEKGPIPPTTFVPLAEDTGQIGRLGQVMARIASRACCDLPCIGLSLNVSALEIRAREFNDSLFGLLCETGFDPSRLQLEVTERVFLEPSEELLSRLQELRNAGIRIAIDDFGVGSTSLYTLHRLPVDVLKIDRSFVVGSDLDPRMDALVRAIVGMGHALSLQVVAEGVESASQAGRLAAYGCDALQGYLFAKPMAAVELEQWFAEDADRQRQRHALLRELAEGGST